MQALTVLDYWKRHFLRMLDAHTWLQREFFVRCIQPYTSCVLSWPNRMFYRMTRDHLDRNERFAVTQHVLGCYKCPEGTAHFELLPPNHVALWLVLCKMLRDESARVDVVNQMRRHHGLRPYNKWSARHNAWPDGHEYWADAQHILMHFSSFDATARCSRMLAETTAD